MSETEQPSIGKQVFEERLKEDPKLQQMQDALDKLDQDPDRQFVTTPDGVKEVSKDTLVVPPSSTPVKAA